MKIKYNDGYFKFEMDEGDYTYQGSCNSINEAKEMFLNSLSDKIDNEVSKILTTYGNLASHKVEVDQKNLKGVVGWFNAEKGYGFIKVEGHEPIFAHYSAIQTEGFKCLDEGEEVLLETYDGGRGLMAKNIRRIGRL